MNLDRKYLVWALGFAVVGMVLGIYMAASQNHSELVAHAHILLIGFVVSFVYGLIHRLWLRQPPRRVANFQFVLHQAAAITLAIGLFLVYGGHVAAEKLEPVLATASIGVLIGMLLMIYMVLKSGAREVGSGLREGGS
jgi:drug/metabolite transporter (DMT)-like permease